MNDRRYTPIRIVLLLGIAAYFVFLAAPPQPDQAPAVSQHTAPATQVPSSLPNGPALSLSNGPALSLPNGCAGQIVQVGIGSYELRLRITGVAERILVYTDHGNLVASTKEAGSAGEYRIRTPGPATAVQLDNCPVLNLR
jgi:hypothetical protein